MFAHILITFLSWFTGRAFWYDLAAKAAEREGNLNDARQMRSAAARERFRSHS